jgi:hypothetical protein
MDIKEKIKLIREKRVDIKMSNDLIKALSDEKYFRREYIQTFIVSQKLATELEKIK